MRLGDRVRLGAISPRPTTGPFTVSDERAPVVTECTEKNDDVRTTRVSEHPHCTQPNRPLRKFLDEVSR